MATLDRARPLPSLRQLIDSGKRVGVFSERVPTGDYPWDNDGFSFVQVPKAMAAKIEAALNQTTIRGRNPQVTLARPLTGGPGEKPGPKGASPRKRTQVAKSG